MTENNTGANTERATDETNRQICVGGRSEKERARME